LIKASIFLGVKFHKVKCEDMRYPIKISEDFFNQQWWETFMQVKYDELLSF
jgi:hypothetical protein